MSRWTRAEIIRQILRREAEGQALSLGGDSPVEQPLYQAASRIFGSWRNAVIAAGISAQKARTHATWSPARILAAIRSLARRRQPPRPNEIKRLHGPLMRAARRLFGSWSAAVTAAGVDPRKLRRCPPWTRERVIEEILMRALRNETLRSHSVEPKSLPSAGIRIFGSWAAALEAAGLNPTQHLQAAMPDEREIRLEPTTECAACTAPTSIASWAIHASRPFPTTESVVAAIHARLEQHKPINASAIYADDRALYRAAARLFKNWRNALQAAGLAPERFRAPAGRTPQAPKNQF